MFKMDLEKEEEAEIKSGGRRLTDFLGLWPESVWWEPNPKTGGTPARARRRDSCQRVQCSWKIPKSVKRYFEKCDCSYEVVRLLEECATGAVKSFALFL